MFGVHGEAADPFRMVLCMFIAVTGIVAFMRSFYHIKFKPCARRRNRNAPLSAAGQGDFFISTAAKGRALCSGERGDSTKIY